MKIMGLFVKSPSSSSIFFKCVFVIIGFAACQDQNIRDMDAEAYLERGNAFFAMGQYNEAISDYIKAIEMNPSYFEAYYNRGQVYGKKGEFKLAICDFNKAIEINPEIEDEYLELLLDESNIIED